MADPILRTGPLGSFNSSGVYLGPANGGVPINCNRNNWLSYDPAVPFSGAWEILFSKLSPSFNDNDYQELLPSTVTFNTTENNYDDLSGSVSTIVEFAYQATQSFSVTINASGAITVAGQSNTSRLTVDVGGTQVFLDEDTDVTGSPTSVSVNQSFTLAAAVVPVLVKVEVSGSSNSTSPSTFSFQQSVTIS